jgi:hypothetical protein
VVATINAVVLTLVTLVYVVITYGMARSGRASAQAAEKAADAARESVLELRSQRLAAVLPFLVLKEVRAGWRDAVVITLSVTVENAGLGPARAVTISAFLAASPNVRLHGAIDEDPLVVMARATVELLGDRLSAKDRSTETELRVHFRDQNIIGVPYVVEQGCVLTPGQASAELGPARLEATQQ